MKYKKSFKNELTCIDDLLNIVNAIEERSFSKNDGYKTYRYYDGCKGRIEAFHEFQKIIGHTKNVHNMWHNIAAQQYETEHSFIERILPSRLIWRANVQKCKFIANRSENFHF